ncbi:hypothetical protein [Xanthobacter autotrophicus]|uniref:hypothetical protein n=1 Tax=Xanthobacter autotrophicus TaxID=280 RepID=UPI00372641B1
MARDIIKFAVTSWAGFSFLVTIVFFLGGEWQKWRELSQAAPALLQISKEASTFVRYGQEVALKSGNLYLFPNPGGGRPETSVLVSPARAAWQVSK